MTVLLQLTLTVTGGLLANSSRLGFAYFYDGVCAPSTVQSVAVLNTRTIVIDPPPRTVGQYLVCYSTTEGASWSTELLFFAVQRKLNRTLFTNGGGAANASDLLSR